MGESRLGGELFGSDLTFGAELGADCFTDSELTCGVELCEESFGAEGAVDEAWPLLLEGMLGAKGRAKLFFAVFLLCDDTLL